MRPAIWVVMLRPNPEGVIAAVSVLSLPEVHQDAPQLDLRLRFNPDIKLFTFRAPSGTTREQVFAAFDAMTDAERHKAYRSPQHPFSARVRRSA